MSTQPPSVLAPGSERLVPWFIPAALGHAGLVVLLLAIQGLDLADRAPLIDPQDAIEVAMVSLPKSPTNVPERASVAPKPPAPQVEEAPPPPVEPPPKVETPPPPKVSDLAHQTEEAEPTPPPVDDKRLDDLMNDLEREMLLDDMDAAPGKRDRSASSPDGSADAPATASTAGTMSDPEYARYVRQVQALFQEHFRPLPTLKGQGLSSTVRVEVDTGGRITARAVSKGSGNPAWDRAALAATEAVASIPLPPERFRDDRQDVYDIRFEE